MSQKLGTAVVGTGYIGYKHARIYSEVLNSHLVAVVDRDRNRAQKIANELGCRAEYDYRRVLDDPEIDVVSICLPENNHVKPAIEFAVNGKHVLLEKPMAMTTKDCDEIIEGIKGTKVKFMVGHLLHFDPKYSRAKECINRGQIGDIIHIVAQRNGLISAGRNTGVAGNISVLHHVGVHDYELALWFSKGKVKRVYSEYCNRLLPGIATQDSFWGLIKFDDGSFASIGSSWVLEDSSGADVSARMEILGTHGLIELDCGIGGSLRIFTKEGWDFPDVYHWPVVNGNIAGALREQLVHFLRCVIEDKKPHVTIEGARLAVRVVELLLESAERGVPVYSK
ncbi:unnamed protein product [marine sediment metagenome]|uniref:Gfo/Idh/MocA-like oxidoreductase N-terminal domain-containing protein n=1 Tax=marine sediment metagenome TaxID=412755 RepID=X0ZDZ9_9ZZZZ